MQRLLDNWLFVKAERCEFPMDSVQFLGFIIENGQLRDDQSEVQAVVQWPTSTTRKYGSAFWDLPTVILSKIIAI